MLTLLRTLFFFVVFWLHQVLILPLLVYFLIKSKVCGPESARNTPCAVGRIWGKLMCWLGGAKIVRRDKSGLSADEAVLFVSNHQGDFDIPIFLGYGGRNLGFVAKKELGKIPLISSWMGLIGCIFLDRDDRRKQVAQIKETIALLKQGQSMVIFPEGTRSRGPVMADFARGSLNIAEKAGVRIVPVSLKDSYTLKPKGSWGFPGGKAEMILHPAVDPASLDKETKAKLHEYIKAIIQSGLDG
ncbi:lysophospholipid acyltransferase family protein [Kiritimatiellota bacterium B12222]|nr:lysophospholipid acyltransferase family protein [Kiritimatiellota bacterium B12222]